MGAGEVFVNGFDLLQECDVGFLVVQPVRQRAHAGLYSVNIEGCDTHETAPLVGLFLGHGARAFKGQTGLSVSRRYNVGGPERWFLVSLRIRKRNSTRIPDRAPGARASGGDIYGPIMDEDSTLGVRALSVVARVS